MTLKLTASPGFSGPAPFSVELDGTSSTTTDPNGWIQSFELTTGDGATQSITKTVTVTGSSGVSGGRSSGGSSGGSTGGGATSGGGTGGQGPVAVLTGGPFSGGAPLSVYLDGTSSYTKDSSGWIQAFSWSFGDGTTSTQGYLVHGFAAPGTYTVKLTAVAGDGTTSTATQQVVAQ